jgi:hypothetical protein
MGTWRTARVAQKLLTCKSTALAELRCPLMSLPSQAGVIGYAFRNARKWYRNSGHQSREAETRQNADGKGKHSRKRAGPIDSQSGVSLGNIRFRRNGNPPLRQVQRGYGIETYALPSGVCGTKMRHGVGNTLAAGLPAVFFGNSSGR